MLDLEPLSRPAQPVALQQTGAIAAHSPMGMMMAAMNQGEVEAGRKDDGLARPMERKEAEKAYNAAFAAFKSEAVRIVKGRKVKTARCAVRRCGRSCMTW